MITLGKELSLYPELVMMMLMNLQNNFTQTKPRPDMLHSPFLIGLKKKNTFN